ncbi:hypothetical protein LV779_19230 [Streptomyces thinghirensis]|nr:hypothetical protein [Streptomyces thinghirensis]
MVSARPEVDPRHRGWRPWCCPPGTASPARPSRPWGNSCSRFARFGLTRDDVVVSVGGGTTTDTVGLPPRSSIAAYR